MPNIPPMPLLSPVPAPQEARQGLLQLRLPALAVIHSCRVLSRSRAFGRRRFRSLGRRRLDFLAGLRRLELASVGASTNLQKLSLQLPSKHVRFCQAEIFCSHGDRAALAYSRRMMPAISQCIYGQMLCACLLQSGSKLRDAASVRASPPGLICSSVRSSSTRPAPGRPLC